VRWTVSSPRCVFCVSAPEASGAMGPGWTPFLPSTRGGYAWAWSKGARDSGAGPHCHIAAQEALLPSPRRNAAAPQCQTRERGDACKAYHTAPAARRAAGSSSKDKRGLRKDSRRTHKHFFGKSPHETPVGCRELEIDRSLLPPQFLIPQRVKQAHHHLVSSVT